MIGLWQLNDINLKGKRSKRVGRGPGSGRGKTSCRGHKGAKARSGNKRYGAKEGGQLPLFQKLPHRGFSNARFKKSIYEINLSLLDRYFKDGETINKRTLIEKGFSKRHVRGGFKVLARGDLTKKVVIEASAFSKNVVRKLEERGIEFKRI